MQVEAVGWVSGMKDVLCGVFALIALWQYVRFAKASGRWRAINYLLATSAFIWALLCKPSAVATPALVVVLDGIVLRRPWKRVVVATAGWWVIAIAWAVLAKVVQPGTGVAHTELWLRPLVAADAIAFYLWKLVWPVNLCVDYGRTPLVAQLRGWLWMTWAAPAAIAALLAWKPNRKLIAAGLVMVLAIGPVLGLTRFLFQYYSTVADHYMYLAMLGPAMALAWVIERFGNRNVKIAAGAALAVLALLSVWQEAVWENDQTLFRHTIAVNPDSFLSYNNLGTALGREADWDLATAAGAEAMNDKVRADDARAKATAEAERSAQLFIQAIQARKNVNNGVDDYVPAHINLGDAYARLDERERAVEAWKQAVKLILMQPPEVRRDLADPTATIGRTLAKLGRYQEAIEYLDIAVRLHPLDRDLAAERDAVARKAHLSPASGPAK